MSEPGEIEILLVEDDPADAELTMRALRRHRLVNKIHWVKDGEQALEYMGGAGVATLPKLVLLDLKMPKVDGMEVLRKLKGSAATQAVPVVIMTSSNEEKDVVESYNLGANSYIVKPVNFESFLDTVAKVGLYWVLTNRVPHDRGTA
ncbi:MAG TPA: response regulator [Burkholderiales bacterium]